MKKNLNKKNKKNNWVKKHISDPYVNISYNNNYRSRAYFKIKSIQEKFNLISKDSFVLELGSAPGGWSQYVSKIISLGAGKIVACDLLDMDPLSNVVFIRGDFRDDSVLNEILKHSDKTKFDLILSDMAPNLTGNASIDMPRCIDLAEQALDMCSRSLLENGSFVVKLFHGSGFDEYKTMLKSKFKFVTIEKPSSSRSCSKEVYIVARLYKV